MRKTIMPFRSGGPHSGSWQIVIPAPIVKKYNINESTCFIVDDNDHGITLSYANIEYKKIPVDKSRSLSTGNSSYC